MSWATKQKLLDKQHTPTQRSPGTSERKTIATSEPVNIPSPRTGRSTTPRGLRISAESNLSRSAPNGWTRNFNDDSEWQFLSKPSVPKTPTQQFSYTAPAKMLSRTSGRPRSLSKIGERAASIEEDLATLSPTEMSVCVNDILRLSDLCLRLIAC